MKELTPAGIEVMERTLLGPVSSLRVKGIGDFARGTKHEQSTYKVEPKHERLPSGGVRFNVETVSAPEEQDLKKPILTRADFLSQIKAGRPEAVSKSPDNLVFAGSQGFFAACLSAFAQHLPLAISPDHIWALISFAFAQHIDKHAEELRANFVQHQGKKRLLVIADHMRMSIGGDPDSGSTPEVWEQTIFPEFSDQIRTYIGDKIHSAIAEDFSSTTPAARAAHQVTLMSAMKHYFSYGISTCCGIPSITLLGSEQDWVALRARAEALGPLMTNKFSSKWLPVLLPVLDEFVLSYKGQVNHGFWQSMVKLRASHGSGARSAISGWLPILYPYLQSGEVNGRLRPWQEMFFDGPMPSEIPPILSSAPVNWNYYGMTFNLHFYAGFTGCTQDADGTLTPLMGWYVTHDGPCPPHVRLKVVGDEIEALVKGHIEEAKADVLDKYQPWFVRVSTLFRELKKLDRSQHASISVESHVRALAYDLF